METALTGTNSTATTTNNIFDGTLTPNYGAVTKYTLMRGVTDFSNLIQFDLFETGYSFLIVLKIPKFMTYLQNQSNDYKNLIDAYTHILEYDFRGANGIEDINTDTNSLTNGINDLNVITRVNEQSGSQFSMNYYERSGSIITKTHELYLRGIKDPRTQVKRYNGLLKSRFTPATVQQSTVTPDNNASTTQQSTTTTNNIMTEKGYHCEIFHFLLIVTDNTALNLEKAYLLTACQPTTANTSIYNVTKGEIGFSELNVTFNGFPISGKIVNQRGIQFLDWINEHTCFDEMNFAYNILTDTESIGIATDTAGNESITKTATDSPVLDASLTGGAEPDNTNTVVADNNVVDV